MLFKCYRCNRVNFHKHCPTCGSEAQDDNVAIDPEFYPEFQYRSQGFLKDLFLKKQLQMQLNAKLDAVLEKYKQFERPYFVNYVHLTGRSGRNLIRQQITPS